MQLVVTGGDSEREVDVRINDSTATVADLSVALGLDPSTGLLIGDHGAGSTLGLGEAGLFQGAEVHAATGPAFAVPADTAPALELRVIGGVDAGRSVPLAPGEVILGRDPGCAVVVGVPTVSRHHCRLRVGPGDSVTLTDTGSSAGTWVDGVRLEGEVPLQQGAVVEVGTVHLDVARGGVQDRPAAIDPLRRATAAGTIPFNRPPRAGELRADVALTLPKAPSEGARPVFSVAALVAPLVLGVVMVVALQNMLFALFTLLTPVMVVGNWYESRFRNKRSLRKGMRDYQAALRTLREQLGTQRRDEVERRRAASPDLAEIVRRATAPSVRLWERRPPFSDFLELSAGLADLAWTPPTVDDRTTPAPEVSATLADFGSLPLVPVPVALARGGVVGITGDREVALALARGLLCQAATLHGPADVRIAVLTAAGRDAAWDWTKWLPHTRDRAGAGGARLLAGGKDECEALLRGLLGTGEGGRKDGPVTLAVIDDDDLTAGRQAPARSLLRGDGGPSAGIVVAASADRLPALCTTVIETAGADGLATLTRPAEGQHVDHLVVGGLAEPTARRCARALARFEDPEVRDAGAALPDVVPLLTLLDLAEPSPEALLDRWRRPVDGPSLAAPIGVSEEGAFSIDLVRDGPHALIGGTTGSGKSELLRSMVASMATVADPDHLTFVLIDYKGGSSFDECARLPHCVGVVTDLDEQLGERALRCLEAELRQRERALRDAGATDLSDYLRRQQLDEVAQRPLPRLVVVIDEFATMVKEVPDFIDSLVGIAQRGRSLGVHLILATQKPSGVVNENIRTNTRLRICLRVEDRQDSTDVIDVGDAADIVRLGRACVRLRPGEVVLIQTALVTGTSAGGARALVDAAPFLFGRSARAATSARTAHDGSSDLSRLVDAAGAAFRASGQARPRRPWPEPLPGSLDLDAVCPVAASAQAAPAGDGSACFALADDPDAQAQYPQGWDPARGNLVIVGNVGSGSTTAMASLALAQARTRGPDDLLLYVLDMGAGDLEPLAGLPHTAAYVGPRERERQMRVLRQLRAELDRRKGGGLTGAAGEPMILLLLDNYGGFTAEYQDVATLNVVDELGRIYADGPEVGMLTVLSGDRAGAIPPALTALTQQRLLLRLSDANDYSAFGITRRQVPRFTPGRALLAENGQVMQIARPAPTLAAAVAATAAAAPVPTRPVPRVGVLPDEVEATIVAGAARLGVPPWFVPLGIGERDLAPTGLTLFDRDHAVVAGPARSGKSTLLCTIAEVVARAQSGVVCLGIAPRRSALRESPDLDDLAIEPGEIASLLDGIGGDGRPHLLLIDDADALDDGGSAIATLLRRGRPDVHVIAAARPDALRPLYGHWTQIVRGSKLGVLLRPNLDLDGELLGTPLPRRVPVAMRDGRGYLVDSTGLDIVQAARPTPGRVISASRSSPPAGGAVPTQTPQPASNEPGCCD